MCILYQLAENPDRRESINASSAREVCSVPEKVRSQVFIISKKLGSQLQQCLLILELLSGSSKNTMSGFWVLEPGRKTQENKYEKSSFSLMNTCSWISSTVEHFWLRSFAPSGKIFCNKDLQFHTRFEIWQCLTMTIPDTVWWKNAALQICKSFQ